jgi:hypothetical protein
MSLNLTYHRRLFALASFSTSPERLQADDQHQGGNAVSGAGNPKCAPNSSPSPPTSKQLTAVATVKGSAKPPTAKSPLPRRDRQAHRRLQDG